MAICLAPAAIAGCSSGETARNDVAATTTQALEGPNCGYSISTDVGKPNKKGFKVKLKITNGDHLGSTGFTVLVSAGAAKLVHVAHGSFRQSRTATSSAPSLRTTLEEADGATDPDVLAGRAYLFNLKFEGPYTQLSAHIISSSGVNCDQTAPTVKLTTSGDFFTAAGSLTLRAEAADDTAVSKVVFSQDGVEIGTTTAAPYTAAVPVTSALNGRHRYSATAYDLTGNQASETKRALVAIDNKFFGTATTIAADYRDIPAHFNQITPGNAGKWGSVEATRDQMNWTDLDTAYDFAKANNIRFKFHTLVWGFAAAELAGRHCLPRSSSRKSKSG